MPLLAFLGSVIFGVPMITAFCARRFGRSFKLWFVIGCILPFISVFILLLLPELKTEESA